MNKKGEQLSINVIVTAAIALIVLVLLVYLVYVNFIKIERGTDCVGSQRGVCASDCASLEGNYVVQTAYNGKEGGCQESEVCCVPVG